MGCGVSKDCTADQTTTKSKKKLIHACRQHLQSALADVSCKHSAPLSAPPHDYIPLSETPTLEEQGETDLAEAEADEENESHIHVHADDDNAEEVIAINHDELEHLENKPPSTQPLHSHSSTHTHASILSTLPSPHKPTHKSPLRELSISSTGKLLDVRKDHLGTSSSNTSSPRSNQFYSGICPSRPGGKAKSNSCSPLYANRVKPLSPIQAWNPQSYQSPNFIKTFADHQLRKEVETIEGDAAPEVARHSWHPVEKTSVVQFDNQAEELFKSSTDAIMDGFIEDLQQEAFESNQLTGRLMAYGNCSGSPNSYMRELLEHFDKSTEPLHMPTTPRRATWQSKLLETIDRDIDNILLEQQAEVAFLGKDQGANIEHRRIDHTQYESIEL